MGWRATWLADEFRKAGLVVVEVEGWKTRGYDFPDTPAEEGVSIFHHTASNRNSGPAGGLRIVTYGREGLAGPIANWLTARNGVIYVVAAGVSNNAGTGNARAAGLPGTTGNSNTLANEMENDGIGEPYPAVQRTAAMKAHAAVHRKLGWLAARAIAHHEWSTTGKIDPLVRTWGTMPAARAQLAGFISGTATEEDDMDQNSEVVGAPDVTIPDAAGAYSADKLKKPLRWWLSALYGHVTGAENRIAALEKKATPVAPAVDYARLAQELAPLLAPLLAAAQANANADELRDRLQD